MGLLDQVLGSALGGRSGGMQGGGGSSPIVMALIALLASRAMGGGAGGGLGGVLGGMLGGGETGGMGGGLGGGLGGLLEQFQRNGHGDAMQSWIGTGPNRSIEPHQLGEALGPDTLSELSRRTGLPHHDLLSELSRVMPGVVDQLTPHGRLPTEAEQAHW
jgi:uncharacterized protein YidB (DUF937 family)